MACSGRFIKQRRKRDRMMAFSIRLSFSLLLFSSCIAVARSKSGCPPSSCGHLLPKISYPFRLKGDPVGCGKPDLELTCEGEYAALHLQSQKFFVTSIDYKHSSFRLVYADFMTSSNSCPVISNIPSLRTSSSGVYFYYGLSMWASFMHCTQEIHQSEYVPVNCLNENYNTSRAYVVVDYDSYLLSYLNSFCSFITTVPVGEQLSPDKDIFHLLQQGFYGRWHQKDSLEEIVKSCWQQEYILWAHPYGISTRSIIMSGLQFLECILSFTPPRNKYFYMFRYIIYAASICASLVFLALRFLFAPLLVFAFLAYNWWRNIRAPIDTVEKFLLNQQQSLSPKRYAYNDIVAMTGHFREKLGQGGFGSVFKGYVLGTYPVAIKMLGSSKFNGDEFINEVSTIGRIHHINVVQLLGFCSEGSKRALIYEYMPNGSLDKCIFPASNKNGGGSGGFSFDRLNDIALGIAKGIDYLHHGCDMQILHFDIKPHNILLDRNFVPKISDFGLAKLYPKDCSLVSVSAARGTIGYIAPELISRSFGPISYKSDIYSFGMLLMEMAGRRRNVDPRAESSDQIYYPSWIYDRLAEFEEPISSGNVEIRAEIDEMERKLGIVGLWCIQMNSGDRPSMSRVVEMLEGDVSILQMPPKPFFSSSQQSIVIEAASSISLSIISENDGNTDLEECF